MSHSDLNQTFSSLNSNFTKLADNKTAIPTSRMSILQGKITRYRDKKKENDKKKEKDAAARMKELQKQQEAMQGPQSAADRMRENFNQFAGSNFAGNSPTALPTVQAPTPVSNQQQKQAAFYEKVACLVRDIETINKYAKKDGAVEAWENIANDEKMPVSARRGAAEKAMKNDTSIPKSTSLDSILYKWGPFALKMLGLGRTDDRYNLDANPANVNNNPNVVLGDVSPYLRGQAAVKGYTTPYYTPSWE